MSTRVNDVVVAITPSPFGNEYELRVAYRGTDGRTFQATIVDGSMRFAPIPEGVRAEPMLVVDSVRAIDMLHALHGELEYHLQISHTDPAVSTLQEALDLERGRVDTVLSTLLPPRSNP